MRLAASDEDEIALIHADLLPALESERGRPPAQVVEHRIWQRGQSQTPGQAQLVVKEESPAQADARQYVRKNVQTRDTLARWTIEHNIRTLRSYRPACGHGTLGT